jgi:hypothetical protein
MMPATFAERLTVSSTAEGYQIRQEIVSGKSCRFRLLYFWDFDAALRTLHRCLTFQLLESLIQAPNGFREKDGITRRWLAAS